MAATATALASVVGAYAGVKQAEAASAAQEQQRKAIEEDQRIQKEEIAAEQKTVAEKRKQTIDKKRRQLYGSGDTPYSIGRTGDTGVIPKLAAAPTNNFTGQELG